MQYEPGPIPPPTLGPRPVVTLPGVPLEQLATLAGAELHVLDRALTTQHQEVASVVEGDIDLEFDVIVGPAIVEITNQLGTLSSGDPARVELALLESMADVDALTGELPAPTNVPQVTRVEGPSDGFQPTEYVEREAPPPEPPAPPTPEPILAKGASE